MSTEAGLLRAIIDDPDDDTPRLIYADWLDDHGDEARAEFIRLQLRLARLPGEHPDRPALEAREKELLVAHAEMWAAPLQGLVTEFGFSRGFIDFVVAEANHCEAFLERLPEVFRLAPITALHIEEFGDATASGLLASPECLSRLRYLMLFGLDEIAAADLRRLLTSPALANLTSLFIDTEDSNNFPAPALAAVGESPALSGLTHLGLAVGYDPGELPFSVLRAVARSAYLRPKVLRLCNVEIGSRQVAGLLLSPVIRGLEELWLQYSEVASWFWDRLLDAAGDLALKKVILHGTAVDPARAARLAERWECHLEVSRLPVFPLRHGIRWAGSPPRRA